MKIFQKDLGLIYIYSLLHDLKSDMISNLDLKTSQLKINIEFHYVCIINRHSQIAARIFVHHENLF